MLMFWIVCCSGRRCVSLEKAASEFRHQFQRDSEMVADRCRQCVDEADRLERERRQFLDDIDHTASIVRDTVICFFSGIH